MKVLTAHLLRWLSLRKVCAALGLLYVLTVMAACEHIELEERPASSRVKVRVEFDWSADPEAAPEEMTVYFYRMSERSGTRNPLRYVYEFPGCKGGTIILPSGYYCAVCHNSDTDCHGLTGHDTYDGFGLRLSDIGAATANFRRPPKVPGAEEERLAWAPDEIWVASKEGIIVSASQDTQVVFEMEPVTHHYTFIIRHPGNFTPSSRVDASLSGMAGTVHPARGVTGDETVTHTFQLTATERGELEGHLRTFGHCGGRPYGSRADAADEPDDMIHRLLLSDDKGWTSVHDVTEHIHGSEDQHEIVVVLDSVTLPPPQQQQGAGFGPNVAGWTGSEEHLGM